MKLRNVGSNQTVVELANGDEVFFSYSTPVAAFISGTGYVRTDEFYSTTTSKHINKWTSRTDKVRPQSFFDNLVA